MPKKIQCIMFGSYVIAENTNQAKELYEKSKFGEIIEKRLHLSMIETYYLAQKGKIELLNKKGDGIDTNNLTKKDKRFMLKYLVFRDLRDKGNIVKTGLKFGADFRVYQKGKKSGQSHSKWLVYCVSEKDINSWQDFAAKNRVAHSTKKSLLIGIVDEQGDVTYFESIWVKP